MVSNSGPPLPMPMQVPPGHMVQQIVDENGILTHVILSPQPTGHNAGLSPSNLPLNATSTHYFTQGPNGDSPPVYTPFPTPFNSTCNGTQSNNHFLHHHNDLSRSHFNPHNVENNRNNGAMSDHHEDRASRQKQRLQEKHARQYNNSTSSATKEPNNHTNNCNGNGNGNGNSNSTATREKRCNITQYRNGTLTPLLSSPRHNNPDKKDIEDDNQIILEFLSRISIPQVLEVESRSVMICLVIPDTDYLSQTVKSFNQSDLVYELRLSEKGRTGKYKPVYNGDATEITLKDLKPATEYHLKVDTSHKETQTQTTDAISFKTLPCVADQPSMPKLSLRTRTSILLKWNATSDNGSKITNYVLECDSQVIYQGLPRQFKVTKLQPSTGYTFKLCALNSFGKSEYSDCAIYHTSGSVPTPPDKPCLVEALIRTLIIDWSKRPNDDEFTLQMEDYKSGHGFLPVFNGAETSHSIRNLKRNTEYKFRLNASNEEGCSKWSEISTYRTLPDVPCPPSRPAAKGKIATRSLRVNWEPPKDTGGCGIDEYQVNIQIEGGDDGTLCYEGAETECLISELLPGQMYIIKTNCSTVGGRSKWSEELSICTQPIKPGQCAIPSLQQKTKSHYINLKWDPPTDTGGAAINQYDIQLLAEKCSEGEEPKIVYSGKNHECVVSALSAGQNYRFYVRATNSAGSGPWSESFMTQTCSASPDAPINFVASVVTPHSLTLLWDPPSNDNGATVTDYRLEWMSGNDFTLLYTGQCNSHEVKSLHPCTEYKFRLQAINGSGISLHSPVLVVNTLVSSPSPVTTIKAAAVSSSCIRLTLRPPHDNGAAITSYVCELTPSGGDCKQITMLATPTDNQLYNLTLEDLLSETIYKIRVQAVNSIGVGPLSLHIKCQTLSMPPLPPFLEISHIGSNFLKLRWSDQKVNELLSYRLEMRKQDQPNYHIVYNGSGHSHKVGKLSELTSYTLRISAINDAGEGPYSESLTFTTSKTVPAAIKATRVSNLTTNSCLIEWPIISGIAREEIVYSLQLQRRNNEFQKIFHGSQNSYELTSLSSHTDYTARVCAIRQSCNDIESDLIGPFSPLLQFRTLANASYSSANDKSSVGQVEPLVKQRRPMSDQQWAIIILFAFTILAVIVAFLSQQLISFK